MLTHEIRFAGERTDTETGLQYLRARTYDPSTGTFLQRDSADGGSYAYAGDSPVNAVDPSGHSPIDVNRSLQISQQIRDHFCAYLGGQPAICGGPGGDPKADSGPSFSGWSASFVSALAGVAGDIADKLGLRKPIEALVDWISSHAKEIFLATAAAAIVIVCAVGPEVCAGIAAGAAIGAGVSAAFYGLGCLAGMPCTAEGFARTVALGAAMGGVAGGAGAAFDIGEDAADAAGASCGLSFSPQTTVLMADGSSKPIDKLRVGDLVEAYDPATGKTGPHRVTAVMVNRDPATEHLVLDTGALETTPNHPFYTTDRGWVEAGQLKIGEHIRTATGTDALVVSFTVDPHPARMWDITVAGAHSFFVGSGEVLVHNCEMPRGGPKGELRLGMLPPAPRLRLTESDAKLTTCSRPSRMPSTPPSACSA